jgi:hypothetical protein
LELLAFGDWLFDIGWWVRMLGELSRTLDPPSYFCKKAKAMNQNAPTPNRQQLKANS